MPGAGVGIGIEEAAHGGVIVAGLEIIETGLVVVVVATVTKRIKIGKGRAGSLLIDDAGSGRIGNPNQLAPCVIGVGGVGLLGVAGDVAVGILNCNRSEDFHHVALLVQRVEIVDEAGAVIGGIFHCEWGASRPPSVAGAREVQRVAATRRLARAALPPDARAAVATGSALGIVGEDHDLGRAVCVSMLFLALKIFLNAVSCTKNFSDLVLPKVLQAAEM